MDNITKVSGGDRFRRDQRALDKFAIQSAITATEGLHNYEGQGYVNDDISKTFEEKFKENPNLTMDDLYKHFCQPMADYYNALNKSRFSGKYKSTFFKQDNHAQLSAQTLEEGLDTCKNLPKDAIFLTFEITPLLYNKSYLEDTIKQTDYQRGLTTFDTVGSYLKPNYVGAQHVVDNIKKVFNITSVEKFIEVLKNLQRISFYNCPSYDEWLKGSKTLKEVCDELNVILDNQRGTYGENKLPKPSRGVKTRNQQVNFQHMLYSSVMLVGIYNDSFFSLSPEKKYCWMKNSDGQIIDGELFPADMHGLLNDNKAVVMSYKNIKIDNKTSFNLMLYDMHWAGLKLGRSLNPGRIGSKFIQSARNKEAYQGWEDPTMHTQIQNLPASANPVPTSSAPPPPPPVPIDGGKTKRKYKKSKKSKKSRKSNKSKKSKKH